MGEQYFVNWKKIEGEKWDRDTSLIYIGCASPVPRKSMRQA